MTTNSLALFFYLFFFIIIHTFSISRSLANTYDTNSLCGQTPYPEQCKYYMDLHGRASQNMGFFKDIAVQVTLDSAIDALSHVHGLGTKCRNELEKAAWTDCLSLYENTIAQLKKTLAPSKKRTSSDQQTWLSAALTNLETCKDGFVELGVADFVFPLMSNNVTKLISNSLALNKLLAPNNSDATQDSFERRKSTAYKEGFPGWVSKRSRRLLLASSAPETDLVVAQDGSGKYTTVQEALTVAAMRNDGKSVIQIKAGVYNENLVIKQDNVMLVGDGAGSTIITGSRSAVGGSSTFSSATVGVSGDGFIAKGITFQNTAGPQKHQAVALRAGSDRSVFYQCSFEGYQDTIYALSQRQFYRDCDIYGTIDFIFGNAAAVFQHCSIYIRKPMSSQRPTVTAQGRTDPNQNTGIVIQNSQITATSDLKPFIGSIKSYLGRPWKMYSRTVIAESYVDSVINKAGWLAWSGSFALRTLYYAEYKNTGPGSDTSGRVTWGGYRVLTNPADASKFSVGDFISGNSWLPGTGVPFSATL